MLFYIEGAINLYVGINAFDWPSDGQENRNDSCESVEYGRKKVHWSHLEKSMHRNSRILSRGMCVAVMLGFSEKEPSGERGDKKVQLFNFIQMCFLGFLCIPSVSGWATTPPYANRRKST